MRPATLRSLAKYVGGIAVELGLRDWEIQVLDDEPDATHAIASTECVFGRRVAMLRFRSDFPAHDPDEQRIVVIHELLHVHLWATDQSVRDATSPLGLEATQVATSTYSTAREYAVDAIATAIAPRFPTWRLT